MTIPTTVVTVSSRFPTEPYYRYDVFLKSLDKLGVTPVVLGMNEPWHGLMTKPNHFRSWLRASSPAPRVIICDSWDIAFAEHPDSINQRCEDLFGDAVVFNGEKGCWPRAELADKFPAAAPDAKQGCLFRRLNPFLLRTKCQASGLMFHALTAGKTWSAMRTWMELADVAPVVLMFSQSDSTATPMKSSSRSRAFRLPVPSANSCLKGRPTSLVARESAPLAAKSSSSRSMSHQSRNNQKKSQYR